jgi:hypothetical protein
MALTDAYSVISVSGSVGATTGTTPVTMISNPGTEPSFIVENESLSVLNRDTVSATVTITIAGSPSAIYETVTLAAGDKYTNPTKIVIGNGQTLTIVLSGAVTTNELTWVVTYFRITN